MLNSKTLRKVTWMTSQQLNARLKSTFDTSWMTWENHGKHEAGAAPHTKWQIGHIIPCSAYDHSNDGDLKRCFALENLMAQDARENLLLGTKLPSVSVLLELRHLWPAAWGGVLP